MVIAVEGDTTLLYGGMTADIIFVTEQKEEILYISKKAIVEKDGKTYVYQKNMLGSMELQEVQTGIDNGVDVEIISGLEEGDTIYLASRVSSEDAVMSEGEKNQENPSQNSMGPDNFGDMGDFSFPEGFGDMENFTPPEGGFDGGNGMPQGFGGDGTGGFGGTRGNMPQGERPDRGGR